MWTFLICGIVLLLYAWIRFKKRLFYPSVIFCTMWGMNCIMHFLIYIGYINPLTEIESFNYTYMDTYIIYFTIATVVGFSVAHKQYGNLGICLRFDTDFIDRLLSNYKWVMWLNFFGGILRIFVMVSMIGFSFSNIIDYRVAANSMMAYAQGGFAGWVFRLTAYINMLAIMYIALAGLRAGLGQLNMKGSLKLFILFAPVQMATGGRLFILYFIIFYLGCFFLGRGISISKKNRRWLSLDERRAIMNLSLMLLPLVVVITLSRSEGGFDNTSKYEGSFLDPFSYISDGTMTTDKCFNFFDGGSSLNQSHGSTTFLGSSDAEYKFRTYKHTTSFASSVYTLIIPLFMDFGYWGSIIAWALLAFLIETIAINNLAKMSLLRFVVYAMLLKICYESVLANPFANNIPFLELIVLLTIFYNPLFGWANRLKS